MKFCNSHLTHNIFNLYMRRFFFGLVYLNIYNSLNQGLYQHTVFEFLVIYRGGGVFSSCENGSYRTCCTNGLGMYTPPRASPVTSVCMTAKNKDPAWCARYSKAPAIRADAPL